MTRSFKVGAVSIGPANGPPSRGWSEADAAIARLSAEGADLVVLPELFALPYVAGAEPSDWRHLAEPLDGPTAQWARDAAARHQVAIVFGLMLDDFWGKPLNAALIARPNRQIDLVAAKIHLPPAGEGDAFGEADHFDPGPAVIEAVEHDGVRFAVLICYDRRFPECWRQAASRDVDFVAVLVGGPAASDPEGLFTAELVTHARANAVYAISAARYGVETILGMAVKHDGQTLAVAPDGRLAALAPADGPGEILVAINSANLNHARQHQATASRLRLRQPARTA